MTSLDEKAVEHLATLARLKFSQEELESIYWNVKSLNELFVIIEKKLSEDPFQYSVKYDESYGFPTDAYFDMDEMIVDEEIGYYVTNFKIN